MSNEDAVLIRESTDDSRGVLAVVADGMGGHQSGEVASALAVRALDDVYFQHAGTPDAALQAAFAAANRAIYDTARTERRHAGMGTTCVAVAIVGCEAYAAHVGDSRLYLLRRGRLYQLTNDDSAVNALVNRGLITREEARRHTDRNVIVKALGTAPDVEASRFPEPLPVQSGDTFLLSSDGLTDLVHDDELSSMVTDAPLDAACRALVDLAKSRGGFDNITVALLRFAPQQPARPSVRDTRDAQVTS